jgi:hypothetical protein
MKEFPCGSLKRTGCRSPGTDSRMVGYAEEMDCLLKCLPRAYKNINWIRAILALNLNNTYTQEQKTERFVIISSCASNFAVLIF